METTKLSSEQSLALNNDLHLDHRLHPFVTGTERPAWTESEVPSRIVNLDTVLDIDAKIGAIEEAQHALEVALEQGIQYAGCDRGSIWLYDAKSAELILACAQDPQIEFIPKKIPAYEGITGRALLEKRTQRIANVKEDPDYKTLCQQHRKDTLYGQYLRSFRSTLVAPLLCNDRPIGIFCAHSPWENDFAESHIALLRFLLRRTAWRLHHAQMLERARLDAWRLASEVLTLTNMDVPLSSTAEPEDLKKEVYQLCAEKALKMTSASVASLRLLDPDKQCLWFAGVAGSKQEWTDRIQQREYKLSEATAARHAIETREPYYIKCNPELHIFISLFSWIQSHISVPLINNEDTIIGVLSVSSSVPYAFNNDDISSLCHLAKSVIFSLEKIQLLAHRGLYGLEHELESIKDVKALCDLAIKKVCKILNSDAGSIFLHDRQMGDYVLQGTTGLSEAASERIAYEAGEGLTGWIIQNKKPLRINDCNDEAELQELGLELRQPGQPKYRETSSISRQLMRYLGAPIIIGDQVVGVMRVVGREFKLNTEFTEADEQLLSAACGLVAAALDRLWLKEEREQHVAELELFDELNQMCARHLNPDDVIHEILHKGFQVLGCTSGHIRLREKATDWLRLYQKVVYSGDHTPPLAREEGDGISGWVAEHKKRWVREDGQRVCVPLMVDGHALGTLAAHKEVNGGFSEHEIHLLESLAAIAASAVRTGWLFEVLHSVSHAMTSVSSIEQLYRDLYHQIRRIMPADVFYVALYDDQEEKLNVKWKVDQSSPTTEGASHYKLEDEDIWEQVITKKQPIRIIRESPDTTDSTDKIGEDSQDGKTSSSVASLLFAPIVLPPRKVIGVLSVQSYMPKAYVEAHLDILSIIAAQASGIQGIQQLQIVKQKDTARANIHRAAATKNFYGLLEEALSTILALINCPRGLIRLVDKERHNLILAVSHGIHAYEGFPFARPIDTGVTGRAVRDNQAQLVNDVSEDEDFKKWLEEVKETPSIHFLGHLESIIAIPLVAGGEVFGVLAAYGDRGIFRNEDRDMLQEVANDAALPIHNAMLNAKARLLEEISDDFRKLVKMKSEGELLSEVLKYTLKLTGCDAGHISVLDSTGDWLSREASVGDTIERLPLQQPADRGINGRALQVERTQLVPELQKNEQFQDYLRYLETEAPEAVSSMKEVYSLLVVPLRLNDHPYGIVCLHDPDPKHFTTVQMSLMDKVGQFTSTLIVKYQENQERQQMKVMADLGKMAAFVAHEINIPFDVILKKAERIIKHCDNDQHVKKLKDIMSEAKRGGKIVKQLLSFVRGLRDNGKGCELTTAVTNALILSDEWLDENKIQLHRYLQDGLPTIAIGESQIMQIFFNLTRNAVDAMPNGGHLDIHTRMTDDHMGVELLVCDTGTGILPEDRDKIFRPYYTTKEPGRGVGLGLSECQSMVREFGGDISFETEVGKGSTFRVTLPIPGE